MSEAPGFEPLSPAGLPDGKMEDNAPVNVDAILQAILGRGSERFGLAAAVLRGERIIAQGVAGVRKRGTAERITLDDRFHLGSCTKAMTATLVAMLVEEGKLNWTTTLGELFADTVKPMHPAWEKVTLRQVLAHRAGLRFEPDGLAQMFNELVQPHRAFHFLKAVRNGTLPQQRLEREVRRPKVEESSVPKKPVEKQQEPVIDLNEVGEALRKQEPPALEASEVKLQAEITQRIVREAESLDYTVALEESVLLGAGRIDLVLRRGQRAIACEVSVTNTIEYEVGNVAKCLQAGFRQVVVVCLNKTKVTRIQERIAEAFSGEQVSLVTCLRLDEFIAKLFDWAADDPEGGTIERGKRRKQRIRLDAGGLGDDERKQKESAMLQKLAEAMKRERQC